MHCNDDNDEDEDANNDDGDGKDDDEDEAEEESARFTSMSRSPAPDSQSLTDYHNWLHNMMIVMMIAKIRSIHKKMSQSYGHFSYGGDLDTTKLTNLTIKHRVVDARGGAKGVEKVSITL